MRCLAIGLLEYCLSTVFVKVTKMHKAIALPTLYFVFFPFGLACGRCFSPTTLLEGKRRIEGVVLRASSEQSDYPASEVRRDDDGWCSDQLGGGIFNLYMEVKFGQDIIFHAVVTEGFSTGFFSDVFLEQYQVEIAGKDEHFRYIAAPINITNGSTELQPAVSEQCIIKGVVLLRLFFTGISFGQEENF